jgi:hypothetical protein
MSARITVNTSLPEDSLIPKKRIIPPTHTGLIVGWAMASRSLPRFGCRGAGSASFAGMAAPVFAVWEQLPPVSMDCRGRVAGDPVPRARSGSADGSI